MVMAMVELRWKIQNFLVVKFLLRLFRIVIYTRVAFPFFSPRSSSFLHSSFIQNFIGINYRLPNSETPAKIDKKSAIMSSRPRLAPCGTSNMIRLNVCQHCGNVKSGLKILLCQLSFFE